MNLFRVSLIVVICGIAAAAAIVFTGVTEVRDVQVNGLSESLTQRTQDVVHDWLGERILGIRRGAVAPLVRSTDVVDAIATALPELADISVSIDAPHTVNVSAIQRVPDGIWCQGDTCQFWDRTGAFWGATIPSVGPLLLLVQDERTDPSDDEDPFSGVLTIVDGLGPLGVQAKYVVLPNAEPGGMRIPTDRGWDLLFDFSADIEDQLSTLDVLLADRASDSSFSPAYIDLRTPGRVYYR